MLTNHYFEAKGICNIDKTECATVQVASVIVPLKGKKQVVSITSRERDELVTGVCAISAAGSTVAPMFIFPRVNYRGHFIKGGPVGSIGCATETFGQMKAFL